MNRSQQVRAIFRELRRSVGTRATSKEILECAAALVDLFDNDDRSSGYVDRMGGLPFDNWALDVAMADGGWRILRYETERERGLAEEDEEELRLHNCMARMSMGMLP